jgi:hypothetical protein
MPDASPDPYAIYPARWKGIATRRWMEMVGELHRLGRGRLRLACSWENAGPAPVSFGVVAPGSYFRRSHGAILARHPFPAVEQEAWKSLRPNDAPMFSSRRCASPRDYPWPGFFKGAPESAAVAWIERYPQLAAEGAGEDGPYVEWYGRMLQATAPTGLIAASKFWEPPPGYMYVDCGPTGVDRFDLPPPGLASEAEPGAAAEGRA